MKFDICSQFRGEALGFQAFLWQKKLLPQDEKLRHMKENAALSILFTSCNSINKIVPVLVLEQLSCIAALPKFLHNSQFTKMSTLKYYRISEYKIKSQIFFNYCIIYFPYCSTHCFKLVMLSFVTAYYHFCKVAITEPQN